jgi:nucleotide-binding universal stress UspA family protein
MYETILAPVDLGDKHSWRKAIPTAVALCEAFDAGLIVMTVIPEVGAPALGALLPHDFEARAKQQAALQLKAFVSAQIPPGIEVRRLVAMGRIYREIIRVAAEAGADLVVMGSRNPDFKDEPLGPNAERVVRSAKGAVMVVRD